MRASKPLADTGLAIGAGNGNQRQPLARLTKDRMSQRSAELPQAPARKINDTVRGVPDEAVSGFPKYGRRTAPHGIGDKLPPIVQSAGIGDEQVTGVDLTTVIRHTFRQHPPCRQLLDDGGQSIERRMSHDAAHSFSIPPCPLAGSPLACCATCSTASWGMPSVRKAPPITPANTGPATSPP